MDMVRMLLASSNRGDQVEQVAGSSLSTPPLKTTRTKGNSARARRSKLRLEEYQKKIENKEEHQVGSKVATGQSSSRSSHLFLDIG